MSLCEWIAEQGPMCSVFAAIYLYLSVDWVGGVMELALQFAQRLLRKALIFLFDKLGVK